MRTGPQPPPADFCSRCGTPTIRRRADDRERQLCPACGWVYYPAASQASAVAIVDGGWVFMVRRKHPPFQGQWTLPSGFLEYGESPEECAHREMEEELGVQVELTDLVAVLMERGDPRGLCLLVVYLGGIVGGRLLAGDDAAEVRAFPLDQLPEEIAFQSHREALQRLRAESCGPDQIA